MKLLDVMSMEEKMCKAMLPLEPQHAAEAPTCNLSVLVYPYQYPTNAMWWSKGRNLLHLAKFGPNV